MEVSVLELYFKSHVGAEYEAWDLTAFGAKINTKAKIPEELCYWEK